MIYKVYLSSQGGKPFAYHERTTLAQAQDLAERLRKRHKCLCITISENP